MYDFRRPFVRPGLYGFLDLSQADNAIQSDLHLHMCSSRTGRLHRIEALPLRDGEEPCGTFLQAFQAFFPPSELVAAAVGEPSSFGGCLVLRIGTVKPLSSRISFLFIRELVRKWMATVFLVWTAYMIADVLT